MVAFVGEAHVGLDELWEEYMWEHVEDNIWREKHSGSEKWYVGGWHLARTLVVTNT